jgi:hypothetical protein
MGDNNYELIIRAEPIQIVNLLDDYFGRSSPYSVCIRVSSTIGLLVDDIDELEYGVFDIVDYERSDRYGTPKHLASIDFRKYPEDVVVFITGTNDSYDWGKVTELVKEIIRKAEQLKFKFTSLPKDFMPESSLPLWERIPDHLSDRLIVRLWNEGKSNIEIAPHVFLKPRSVTNVLSRLRDMYGEDIVLTNSERRKRLMKN